VKDLWPVLIVFAWFIPCAALGIAMHEFPRETSVAVTVATGVFLLGLLCRKREMRQATR